MSNRKGFPKFIVTGCALRVEIAVVVDAFGGTAGFILGILACLTNFAAEEQLRVQRSLYRRIVTMQLWLICNIVCLAAYIGWHQASLILDGLQDGVDWVSVVASAVDVAYLWATVASLRMIVVLGEYFVFSRETEWQR